MDKDIRLPIKIVIPRGEDMHHPEGGGGGRKTFGDVTKELREQLADQTQEVGRYFQDAFRKSPHLPAVGRVLLKKEALAKSHRPSGLLNKNTCPIIGVAGFGELLISVTNSGLRWLTEKIQTDNTRTGKADISTVDRIEPHTPEDAVGPQGFGVLREQVEKDRCALKLRLFRHHDPRLDEVLLKGLFSYVDSLGLDLPEEVYYSPKLRIFRIRNARAELVELLARFIGTQSLSSFPAYRALRIVSVPVRPLATEDFPPPESDLEYPVIGIIDTGTNPMDKCLSPWVKARHEYVPEAERDYDHGSFVAGLAIHPRLLNGDDPRFPDVSSRIVDVVAVPGNGVISEDELLSILDEVIPQHPEVHIWNLSLSTRDPCRDHGFSELAVALDERQDKYGVVFVMAAGNYLDRPFRGWPPEDLGESDRITAPADCARGLAVGSVAHLEKPHSRVRRGQPSPFSRRGPGPVFLPKPELTHYGGNCDSGGSFGQTGVLSTDGQGRVAENVGTSFTAPIVASLLANVEKGLLSPPTRSLVKALTVHSAVLGSEMLTAEDLRYRGFGVPSDLVTLLTCAPWAATLIFETELVPGLEFEKWPFPIPDCLRGRGGKLKGEVIMTLAYEPPLDATYGAEYCRTNVDASLGTYDEGPDGERVHRRKIPPEPEDINRLYEIELVRHGFKWSPIKVFRRQMKRGIKGNMWRLNMTALHRREFATSTPQKITLVVTIMDPEQKKPVYDDVVALLNQLAWSTLDLEVQERIRARV